MKLAYAAIALSALHSLSITEGHMESNLRLRSVVPTNATLIAAGSTSYAAATTASLASPRSPSGLSAPSNNILEPANRNTKDVWQKTNGRALANVLNGVSGEDNNIDSSIITRMLQASPHDIVVGNYNGVNQILVGNADGGYGENAVNLAGGEAAPGTLVWEAAVTMSITIADINKDGHADIIVGNGNQVNRLLINNGAGVYPNNVLAPVELPGIGWQTHSIATADVNKDGWADLIVGNYGQANKVLLNDGTGAGTFLTEVVPPLPGGTLYTNVIATADVDNDGWDDIIVGNQNQVNQLLLNDGFGGYNAAVDLPGGLMNTEVIAVGDVNKDSWADIVVGNINQANQLLLNNGAGGYNNNVDGLVTLPGGFMKTHAIAIADINGDTWPDIFVGNAVSQVNHLLINVAGEYTVASSLEGGDMDTRAVAVADVDDDGDLDIIIGNYGTDNQLLTNDGTGTFTPLSLSVLPGGNLLTHGIAVIGPPPAAPSTTPGPWSIVFNAGTGLTTDFTASSDKELTLTYQVGKDRTINAPSLYKEDCTTPISDITITQFPDPLATTPIVGDDDYESLTLEYDIDKSAIGGSTAYDSVSGQLKVCQVVQLIEQSMVIYEDKRLVTVTFLLDADFTFDLNVDLAEESVADVADTSTAVASVQAVKCSAGSTNADANPIAANTELYVCLSSASADVEIASIEEMDIGGTGSTGTAVTLPVIDEGAISFSAFTSVETLSASERRVKTRVPASIFDYNGNGKAIDITGSVTMVLAGGRKLRVMVDNALFEDSSNDKEFEVIVGLKPEMDVTDNYPVEMNSSTSIKGSISIIIGMLAFVNAIW